MTDSNKLDLILQSLQTIQENIQELTSRVSSLESRMVSMETRMDSLDNGMQELKSFVRTLQASQEFSHARIDGLEKSTNERADALQQSLDAHRILIDSRFQQLDEHLNIRFTDTENQIGTLREEMIDRFHATLDHIDGQAKIWHQTHQLAEKRTNHRFEDMKRHFDTKFNLVHERFVEVQEDLDTIRLQTARNPESGHPHRRSSRR